MGNPPPPHENSELTPGYAEKSKRPSTSSSRKLVKPNIKGRNMTLLLFSPNEIEMLKDIYNNIQSSMNLVWFFLGIAFTLIISRLSMSAEQYNTTPIAYMFWWVLGISIFFSLIYCCRAWKESKKESKMMENIEKEMVNVD